ncbi:MAG: dienelactone hydrolase family protein [Candidatus Hydrogenedentes bacterium]|nr:dienelactone hydrolase family protein [Candidatus Hydrogenedentota bacterium]
MIDLRKVVDTDTWREQREKIRRALFDYIGENFCLVSDPLYEEIDEDDGDIFVPDTKIIEESTVDKVRRLVIEYSFGDAKDEGKKVNGVVFTPVKYKKESLPAVLCCPDLSLDKSNVKHTETFEEVVCKGLAELGYITLVPDYSIVFRSNEVPRKSRRVAEKNVANRGSKSSKEAQILEILSASLCVFGTWISSDIPSIGVIGKNFGALQAILLTAMEAVVQSCVAIGDVAQWRETNSKHNWICNKEIDILPELRRDMLKGESPIDLEHIMALCAPSALLLLNPVPRGESRRGTKSVPTYLKPVVSIYEILGMPEAIKVVSKSIREDEDYIPLIEDWLSEWL